jgi:succinoglycan biosynthesis protein ExoM
VTPARNAAMGLAVDAGFDFVAFLDDDEVPEPVWLEELLKTALAERCDIVCGPVEPMFGGPPPAWALAGRFFCKSGETLCSSNLLLRVGALAADRRRWFYPEFGTTGGGDREFLKRLVDGGPAPQWRRAPWCASMCLPHAFPLATCSSAVCATA